MPRSDVSAQGWHDEYWISPRATGHSPRERSAARPASAWRVSLNGD